MVETTDRQSMQDYGFPAPDFWRALFDADTIAVIGAKNSRGTWGGDALNSAIEAKKLKTSRRIYGVNPSEKEVMGQPAFPTVLDIPDSIDLAVIVVPAKVVPQVFRQCGEKGVKAAVIISAGFSEVGGDGTELEKELLSTAVEYGMHFIGPNCIGHADLHSGVSTAAIMAHAPKGKVALLSQSGTLGASIMQALAVNEIGLSKFVSTGNEANLHLEDFIQHLGRDKYTQVIAAYVEGLRQGRRFYELAKEITQRKPIVVIKSGGTGEAAKAARSHTGALSGSDVVHTAAFRQSGVIRVDDEEELRDVTQGLLYQPLPAGNRVAILTIGGGFGVVTAEACEKEGLKIAHLEESTLVRLDGVLPPRWARGNPVDMVGIRPGEGDTTVVSCLRYLLEDPNVDSVISLLQPIIMASGDAEELDSDQLLELETQNKMALDKLAGDLKEYHKPVYMITRYNFIPSSGRCTYTPTHRFPEFTHHRRGAKAISRLAWYRRYREETKTARE